MCNSKEPKKLQKSSGRVLPVGFAPSDDQVIIGRSKTKLEHEGNKRYLKLVDSKIKEYVESSRGDKTFILMGVVYHIRNKNKDRVGFVKRDCHSGRWFELNEDHCRFHVAQAFRNAAHTHTYYKSSETGKQHKRKAQALESQEKLKKKIKAMKRDVRDDVKAITAKVVANSTMGPPRHWEEQKKMQVDMRVRQEEMPREKMALMLKKEMPMTTLPSFVRQGPPMIPSPKQQQQQQGKKVMIIMSPPIPVPAMMQPRIDDSHLTTWSNNSGRPSIRMMESEGIAHHQYQFHHQERGGRELVGSTSDTPWPVMMGSEGGVHHHHHHQLHNHQERGGRKLWEGSTSGTPWPVMMGSEGVPQQSRGRELVDHSFDTCPWPEAGRNFDVHRPDPPTASESSDDDDGFVRNMANHHRPDPPAWGAAY